MTEREDGYIAVADAVRYFTPPEELTPLDTWACEQVQGRVLDIGCGAGRHSLAVQALGHEAVGVDSSAGAVRVAVERGVTAVVGSFEDVPLDLGSFETLLLLGNNLGLLDVHSKYCDSSTDAQTDSAVSRTASTASDDTALSGPLCAQ